MQQGIKIMHSLAEWLARKKFQFEIYTSLNVLEPPERLVICIHSPLIAVCCDHIFNTIIIIVLGCVRDGHCQALNCLMGLYTY